MLIVINSVLYHYLPNHREQCISMVVSLQGMNSSFQRVKHWLKVSEHIFEMLALMGMLLVSFCLSHDTYHTVIPTCGQSDIIALFLDSISHPRKHFCTKNLCTQSL